MRKTTCKSCGRDIHFIKMQSGKFMPCDPEHQDVTLITVMGESKRLRGYVSHYQTCNDPDRFRKGGKSADK